MENAPLLPTLLSLPPGKPFGCQKASLADFSFPLLDYYLKSFPGYMVHEHQERENAMSEQQPQTPDAVEVFLSLKSDYESTSIDTIHTIFLAAKLLSKRDFPLATLKEPGGQA